MKYFLPKYIPIYQSDTKLCIGFVNKDNQYVEFDYSSELFSLIEYLIINGINDNDLIKEVAYTELKQKNLLITENFENIIHRGDLFLKYIGNQDFDESVKNTHILIFGAGAIGSTLIYLLVQFGFKNITIVDFDKVEVSDVLKSTIFDKSHIGLMKTEALKNKIFNNFDVIIKTWEDNLVDIESIENFIKNIKPDFIVKAADPILSFRTYLNKVAYQYKIPTFHLAYSFESIKVGPLYIPDFLGCDECLNLNQQKTWGVHYAFEKDIKLFEKYQVHPSVSFNINIVSNFGLKEIIFFLTGKVEYCFPIGKILDFNPLSFYYNYTEVCANR